MVQQLEAARREIIARAYVEKIGSGAPKPTPPEIKAYYEAHPALFKERRVYSLQELSIQAKPEEVEVLRSKLAAAKDFPAFLAFLKESNFKFSANQVVRAAEQLPMASVDKFAAMKDGESVFNAAPGGVQILFLAGSRTQPVDEQRAVPAVEQFLLNERKRKVVEDDLKALRAAAKIEYVGEYAKGGAKEVTPAPITPEAPPLMSVAPAQPAGSMPSAARQIEVEPINTAPASSPTSGVLEKGIKGFK